jgi:hypothetical protein
MYFLYFNGETTEESSRRCLTGLNYDLTKSFLAGRRTMDTIKGFWQHANGKVYAIESDTFGRIIGGAGPLEPHDLRNLNSYDYKPDIVKWLVDAAAQHKLHRINVKSYR